MDEAGFTGDLTAGFKEAITHKTLKIKQHTLRKYLAESKEALLYYFMMKIGYMRDKIKQRFKSNRTDLKRNAAYIVIQ